jgi:prolyl-tRNA synthetase
MRQSQLYIKTRKEAPKDEVAKNAILLTRAGYIHKEIAGVYTMLPLGLRVLNKIENIIRREMDFLGNEITMTALAPREYWEKTGRVDTVDVLMKTAPANKVSEEKSSHSYILGSTHEEMITPLVQEYTRSYKDLPLAFYQIQTKFRNEARAKSGILRGREFKMKDLYSFHRNEEDLKVYYDRVKDSYMRIFKEVGLGDDTFVTLASGGDFTKDFSHEFQTICDAGEDHIYLDRKKKIAYNKEVVTEDNAKKLGVDFAALEQVKACEVGNIFPLNTKFSKAFGYTYADEHGTQQDIYMGSYGIGPTRLMGVIVEKFSDEKGLIWPESVAPFSVHLLVLNKDKESDTYKSATKLYETLTERHVEVLFDDRDTAPGEKFADSDLLGIPMRVVVSDKSLSSGGVEIKERKTATSEIVTIEQFLKMYSGVC